MSVLLADDMPQFIFILLEQVCNVNFVLLLTAERGVQRQEAILHILL